jgi:hypothetical protein
MKPTVVQPQLQWILLLQDRSPPAHRKSLRGVQAVNREADSIYGHRLLVGSAPPSCQGKCGSCNPCNPIHVSVGSPHGTLTQQEYYPEVWRCKCGNRLFMPWNVQGTYSCKATSTSTYSRATSNDISRRNLLTLRKHSSSRCKGYYSWIELDIESQPELCETPPHWLINANLGAAMIQKSSSVWEVRERLHRSAPTL